MAVYIFDEGDFRDRFPELDQLNLTSGQLEMAFDVASLLIDNTESSIIPYDPENGVNVRKTIILLAMAHIGERDGWSAGQTGALASASQGSVSTSFAAAQGTDDWWASTKYGQLVLRLLTPYVIGGRFFQGDNYHPWG